jgi:hypothetical protein
MSKRLVLAGALALLTSTLEAQASASTTYHPFHLHLLNWICTSGTWDEAYALASSAVAQMTLDEKLGIAVGTGQLNPNRSWFPYDD